MTVGGGRGRLFLKSSRSVVMMDTCALAAAMRWGRSSALNSCWVTTLVAVLPPARALLARSLRGVWHRVRHQLLGRP